MWFIYAVAISLLAVVFTVADKSRAKRGKWRVPERTLFAVALLGGAAAMYITMRLVRHKTLHKRFMIGLPLIFLAQVAILVLAESFFGIFGIFG